METEDKSTSKTLFPTSSGFVAMFVAAALVMLLAVLFFGDLGRHAFNGWDEGIYAQVAKESLLNHNQISFTYWGNQWYEKPPLMIWLTEVGYSVFGMTEFGGRFFVSVFALGIVVLTYALIKTLFRSHGAALVGVAGFFLSFQFLEVSQYLYFDIPVAFFALLSIYGFVRSSESPRYYYLFWAAIALGVLTKSVIGLIPAVVILLHAFVSWEFSFLKKRQFWYGFALFLALVLPWHVIQSVRHGRAFWDNYLFYHVLKRYAHAIENNGGPFNYYLRVMFDGWQNTVLVALSAASSVYFFIRSWKDFSYRLVLTAALFVWLLFSMSKTVGYEYIVPIYPFLVTMIGASIWDIVKLLKSAWQQIMLTAITVLIFVGLGLQQFHFLLLRADVAVHFDDNRAIAQFLHTRYPDTPVYAASWNDTEPSMAFYYGQPIPLLQSAEFAAIGHLLTPNRIVFHRSTRNLYMLDGYIFMCWCGAPGVTN